MYRKNWFYNGNDCSTMLLVLIMSVFKYVHNYNPDKFVCGFGSSVRLFVCQLGEDIWREADQLP